MRICVKTIYKRLKIKQKIFWMTFFLMLMIGVYSLIAFHYVTELYQGQIYDEAAETLNISSNLVDNELRELEQLSFQMITDDRIQTYLQFLNRSE
ncbi:MAG: two-component sensor histidine kinase, partial [Novibacillus thermophilus]